MNNKQIVVRNLVSISISKLLVSLSSAFLGIFIARYLGAEPFGELSFAVGFTAIFSRFGDLGLTPWGVRTINRKKEDTKVIVTHILIVQLLIALLSISILTVFTLLLPFSKNIKLLTLLSGLVIIPEALNMSYVFRAHEKMWFETYVQMISQVVYFVMGFLLVYSTRDVTVVPVIKIITGVIIAVFAFLILVRKFDFAFSSVSREMIKTVIIGGFPFMFVSVGINLYDNIMLVIIQFIRGESAVGYFNAVSKVVVMLLIATQFLKSSLYPTITRLLNENKSKAEKLLNLAIRYLLLLTVPLTFGGIMFAEEIIQLIYGDAFTASVLPFKIFLLFVSIYYMRAILEIVMFANNKEKKYSKLMFGVALLRGVLGIGLVFMYSVEGAVMSVIISELILVILVYRHTSEVFGMTWAKPLLMALAGSTMMVMILLMLKLPWVFEIIMGMSIYIAYILAFRIVTLADVKQVKALLFDKKAT